MTDPVLRPARERQGFALAIAMVAIVLIGALIAGAFFASTQEYRVGRNTLVGQRAFSVAEYGLNSEIANWDRSRNLPDGMAVGAVDSSNVYVTDGDTARVKVSRLNENTFWVVAEGSASMGQAIVKSVARTNSVVRIAYPAVNTRGAVTTAGNLMIGGSSRITGLDVSDTSSLSQMSHLRSWGACAAIADTNVAGVAVGPTASVAGQGGRVSGSPSVSREPVAVDSNTYVRYGSETWNTLAANADIILPAGDGPTTIGPVGTATTCDVARTDGSGYKNNWGEPYRGAGSVAGCQGRFPIIYARGDLHLRSNGRGQGILLVEGDFRLNGSFEWYGLIIVKDDILKGNGNATIVGSVMARNARIGQRQDDSENNTEWTGNQNVYYSKCSVESALRASAILVPVRERAWSQFF